jgi:hypothetical protein
VRAAGCPPSGERDKVWESAHPMRKQATGVQMQCYGAFTSLYPFLVENGLLRIVVKCLPKCKSLQYPAD